MQNATNLITPRQELKNEYNELLVSITDFMNKAQDKGYRLAIDARLDLTYKIIRAELYKPLVEIEQTEHFEQKEVSDGSV